MIETRVTSLLGIRYPIIQAAMAWITNAEMVASVSNAGGLGTLGPNAGAKTDTKDAYETGERLRNQIKKVRKLTDKPFAVNIVVPSDEGEKKFSDACLEVAIEEKVPIAIVSQGSPSMYTGRLKAAGTKVLHVVSVPKHAKNAEEAGVDGLITSGTEGGGHGGFDQLTTFILIPQVSDYVKLPVIAGGGIADSRGFIAALALGAEGVYMGTRFAATQECPAHPNLKQALLKASAVDTVTIKHGAYSFDKTLDVQTGMRRGSLRLLLNKFSRQVIEMETRHATPEEILDLLNYPLPGADISRTMASSVYGDPDNGRIGAGQDVGLINDIPSCKELIERIINGADNIIERISSLRNPALK